MQREPRRLSSWLLAGLIMSPLLFGWFLLRRGYSRTLRLAAFTYAAVMLGSNLAGILGSLN